MQYPASSGIRQVSGRDDWTTVRQAISATRWQANRVSEDLPYFLTAEAIAAMEGLAKTHYLDPNAKRINKSLGDATGLTGLGIHLIEVEPGRGTSQYHVHHFEEEAVYVLSGTATAEIGDDTFPIKPGDFLGYRKKGAAHAIRNTGDETLVCLVIGQRLAHDVADYPRLGKRLYRNEGMPWDLVDIEAVDHPQAGAKK